MGGCLCLTVEMVQAKTRGRSSHVLQLSSLSYHDPNLLKLLPGYDATFLGVSSSDVVLWPQIAMLDGRIGDNGDSNFIRDVAPNFLTAGKHELLFKL
jgi:hypothetical protein